MPIEARGFSLKSALKTPLMDSDMLKGDDLCGKYDRSSSHSPLSPTRFLLFLWCPTSSRETITGKSLVQGYILSLCPFLSSLSLSLSLSLSVRMSTSLSY